MKEKEGKAYRTYKDSSLLARASPDCGKINKGDLLGVFLSARIGSRSRNRGMGGNFESGKTHE